VIDRYAAIVSNLVTAGAAVNPTPSNRSSTPTPCCATASVQLRRAPVIREPYVTALEAMGYMTFHADGPVVDEVEHLDRAATSASLGHRIAEMTFR
jgi:hypothetical protein